MTDITRAHTECHAQRLQQSFSGESPCLCVSMRAREREGWARKEGIKKFIKCMYMYVQCDVFMFLLLSRCPDECSSQPGDQ